MSRSISAMLLLFLAIPLCRAAGQGFDDEFNGFALNPGWTWLNPTPPYWQLTGEAMRIITLKGALNGPNHNDVKNILLQPAPSGDFRMDTRLIFSPDSIYHNAGLIYMLDEDNYVRVSRGMWNNVNGIWLEWELNALTDFKFIDSMYLDTLHLRMSRVNGYTFRGAYSLDGSSWIYFGETTVPFQSTEARIGLQAANGQGVLATSMLIPADFDYFRVIIGDAGKGPLVVGDSPSLLGTFPSPAFSGALLGVSYALPGNGVRRIMLTDLLGRTVRLHESVEEAGVHEYHLPLEEINSGAYLLTVEFNGMRSARMLTVR